jgi:hypothetical protein
LPGKGKRLRLKADLEIFKGKRKERIDRRSINYEGNTKLEKRLEENH